MIGEIISERVRDYAPVDALEQENVLVELLQHYVLAALARTRFFSRAGFHGGTCLHICYGMRRFSEDLDFLLKEPDPNFDWGRYIEKVIADNRDEGIRFEPQDKSKAETAVKKYFLKTGLSGAEMQGLKLPFPRHPGKKIRIKLEADVNPPDGSGFETRYIDFPVTAAITTQTLASGFATKSHALLCREYVKGRDWYDFLWYVTKKIVPDSAVFANALKQQGPWAGQSIRMTRAWYLETMRQRIKEIDWGKAREDVNRFIPARERESLNAWGPDLFLQSLDRMAEIMGD